MPPIPPTPLSYARSDPTVRARIVERIAAGETLKAVCSEAGMPCAESVTGWIRREPGFADEMIRARRAAAHRRRFTVDPAAARAIVAGLGNGEAIAAILRGPGMPSYRMFTHWRRTDMAFAEAVQGMMQQRRARKAARLRGRLRPYDRAVGEKIYVRLWMGGETLRAILRSEPEFPSLSVLARWRPEQPAFDEMLTFVMGAWRRKVGVRGAYAPELAQAVLDGIVEGGSLRSLGGQGGLPCARTLYAWVRTRPRFAEAVAQACVDREDIYADQIVAIAMQAPVIGAKAARARMAPLSKQLTRLRKRPGWKRRGGR